MSGHVPHLFLILDYDFACVVVQENAEAFQLDSDFVVFRETVENPITLVTLPGRKHLSAGGVDSDTAFIRSKSPAGSLSHARQHAINT